MNQERNDTDPDNILRLKDELLERFSQLSADHQATITLVIVKRVMEGEWGEWLQGTLETHKPLAEELGDKSFPITSVSREDLQQLHFSEEDIERLTDQDMQNIAQKMAEHYVNDIFWDELKFQAQSVLDDKGHQP